MGRAERRAGGARGPEGRAHKPTSNQLSQRMIFMGMGLVALAAIIVVIFGWYQTSVAAAGRTAIQVGDIEISYKHLENRIKLAINEGTGQTAANQIVATTAQQMEQEALLLQAAGSKGISVSEENIDSVIKRRGGLPEDVDARTFAQVYRQLVATSGLSRDEFRQKIKAELMLSQLQEKLATEVQASGPQVQIKWMLLTSKENADAAIARLSNGEDFWAVVQAVEPATNAPTEDALTRWFRKGEITGSGQAIEDWAFSAEVGSFTKDPIVISGASAGAQDIYVVVKLLDRQAEKEYTDTQKSALADDAYSAWLQEQAPNYVIDERLTEDDLVDLQTMAQKVVQEKAASTTPITVPTVQVTEGTPSSDGTPAAETPVAETPAGGDSGQ